MKARSGNNKTWKPKLLSYAVAMAASGFSAQALAVDLCDGNVATTINGGAAGNSCILDTTGDSLTVGSRGRVDEGVTVLSTGINVTNAGRISSTDTAVYYDTTLDGSLTNTGTIIGEDTTSDYAAGVYISGDLDGTITNRGTIKGMIDSSDAYPSAYGIYVNGDVGATGVINNSGVIAAEIVTDNTNYGSNYGIYVSGDMNGEIRNSGQIRTAFVDQDSASGYQYGIYVSGMTGGSITNSGSILQSYEGISGDSAYGIYVSSTMDAASITNSGLIAYNANTFWDDVSFYGIYTSDLTNGSSILNSGTIRADVSIRGDYDVSLYGIYTNSLTDSSITNSGLIDLNVAANPGLSLNTAYGIYVSGSMTNSQISNTGTISLEDYFMSELDDIYGIYVSSSLTDSSVTNSGRILISGTATNDEAYGVGIETGSLNGASTVTNSGLISINFVSDTESTAYGMRVDSISTDSVFSNTGTITLVGTDRTSSVTQYGMYASGTTDGSFVNSGSITMDAEVFADAYVYQYGMYQSGAVGAAGTLENSGTISATAEAKASSITQYGIRVTGNADGSVINSGTISLVGSSLYDSVTQYGIRVSGSANGTVLNSGTISLQASGQDDVTQYGIRTGNSAGGTIANTGSILLNGTAGEDDVTQYGIRTGSLSAGATVSNSGTISLMGEARSSASGYGIYVNAVDASSVENTGTITINQTVSEYESVSAYGIYTNSLSNNATVSNSGLIDIDVSSYSENSIYGIYVSGSVNSGSSVSNTGTIRVRAEDRVSSNTVYGIRTFDVNAGTVSNSGVIDIVATPGGEFGEVGNYLYGIYTSTLTDANVENTGTIRVSGTSRGNSNASVYGMYVSGSLNGATTVANSGTISGYASSPLYSASFYGIATSSISGTSSLTNSGSITGYAYGGLWEAYGYGISTGSLSGTGAIDNSGSINVKVVGQTSASVYGISTGSLQDASTVTNSGTISIEAVNQVASYVGAYGIDVGAMTGTASITNTGDIIVKAVNEATRSSDSAYATGIWASSMAAGTSITNSGLISTDVQRAGDDTERAYAVYVGGGTGGALSNSGTMIGGVYLGGSGKTLTNSGSITTWHHSDTFVGEYFTNQTGAALTVEMSGTGSYAQITATGTLDLTDANTLAVIVDPWNTLQDGDVLADVLSGGTLTTPVSGVLLSGGNLFWGFTGEIDGNTYDLTAAYSDAATVFGNAGVDISGSQATALDSLLNGGQSGDLAAAAAALNASTNGAQLASAVGIISPAINGAAAQATIGASAAGTNIVSKRQSQTRGASSGDGFSDKSWWIKPYFGQAEQSSANGFSGYEVDSNGFVVGVDGAVSDDWRVGLALGLGAAEVEADASALDIDTTQLTVYGTWAMSDVTSMDVKLGYGMHGYDGARSTPGGVAKSDYDGNQLLLAAELKRVYELNEDWTFTPGVGLTWTQVDIDGYSETGAGAFNLTTSSADEDSLILGLDGEFERTLSENSAFTTNVRLAFDSATEQAAVDTTLSGLGTYTANGVEQDELIYGLGLGYRYATESNLEFSANYDLELRDGFDASLVSVRVQMPF